ncbi:hypothetical protein GCM10011363_43350 [Marivita lacus]|uniref:Transposase DDE domain-containing protein n=1 Tax=Marivita lacus TaxID=1323742 RepID=A0ABQ1LAB9_9RHOB|nr:hypothetical protein GCM10011363_43350 [Marivita lacus]
MDHPEGAGETDNVRLGFDCRVRLEFHGSKISSDGGLLLFRELDEVLGLHDIAGELLTDTRTGHNRLHSLWPAADFVDTGLGLHSSVLERHGA